MEMSQKVGEAFAIVRYIAENGPQSIKKISNDIGLNPLTTKRMVETLRQHSMATRRDDGSIALGARFIRWADAVPDLLVEAARDVVNDLSEKCEATVVVARDKAPEFEIVLERDGRGSPLRIEHIAGTGYLMERAAPGIAILAHQSAQAQREALARSADAHAVSAAIDSTLDDGYVIFRSTIFVDRTALSIPLLGDNVTCWGSLSIVFPASREDELPEMIPEITQAAQRIVRRYRELAGGMR